MIRGLMTVCHKIFISFLFIFLIVLITVPAFGQAQEIRIGVLATRSHEDTLKTWSPTAEYLTNVMHQYSFVIVPLDFDNVIPAVDSKEIDFILTHPSNYVELETSYGVSRIATMKYIYEGHAYKVFGSVIFRRTDRSDINDLYDLKGKSFMGAHEKLMAWEMAWKEFKDNGIDPYRDFSELKWSGLPQDMVVYAVRDGRVDAGEVRTGILESMASEGRINLSDFTVINPKIDENFLLLHSTKLYPEWAFAKAKQTPEELSEKVAIALLNMPPDSQAAKASNVDWTVPLDYQPVHELMKDLKIGPYKDLGRTGFFDIIKIYWYWIVITALLIFLVRAVEVEKVNKKLKQEIDDRKLNEKKMKKDEKRASALLDIFQEAHGQTEEMVRHAVEEAVKLTDSELGFIGFIDEHETIMTAFLFSAKAMQECAVDNRSIQFSLIDGGLWAEAAKQHRTIIVNDYSQPGPYKKGCPEGHVSILRFIGVPIIRNGRTVLLCGLANKKEEYDASDIQQINLFMEGIWGIISRRRAEEGLRVSEYALKRSQTTAHVGHFSWDSTTNKVALSDELYRIFGIERENFTGDMNEIINTAVHTDDREIVIQAYEALKSNKKHDASEFRVIWPDGSIHNLWAVIDEPVPDNKGSIHVSGVVQDITQRKQAEEQITNSLKEKELLLKEIHHRVKNNMQIISSLVQLQSEHINNEVWHKLFMESKNRIDTMALIHEKLYMSTDLSKIDFTDYVNELVGNLYISYGINIDTVRMNIDIAKVFFQINTVIPLGLMINELISNIMKYAFPEGRKGEIKIILQPYTGDKLMLVVSDNGIGFPENLDFRNTQTLGLKLVNSLTKQLGGTIELDRTGGTTFRITFGVDK